MQIKKPLLIAGAIATIGMVGASTLSVAAAQSASHDSLVDKLASRFNLNKDEVRSVFEEAKQDRQAERQAEVSQELQGFVESGDITAEQKTLIEAKLDEVRSSFETERASLEAWAEEQGIDLKYVAQGRGPRGDHRLEDAVNDGDITAEQQAAINAKLDELRSTRDSAMDTLEQWAQDNDIDVDAIQGLFGHGRGHHTQR